MTAISLCTLLFIFTSTKVLSNPSDPSSVQEVIQKINPTLDRITLRLKELKLDIHKTLLKVTVQMHGSIFNSESAILEAVEGLQSKSVEIINIATENNLDVDQCVAAQKSGLERILMLANSETSTNFENINNKLINITETANELIRETDNIEKNINKVIGFCIRQYNLAWQKERLLHCLFNETAEVDSIVDKYYARKNVIDEEMKRFNSIKKCNNNFANRLSLIHKEFLKCVIKSSLRKNQGENSDGIQSIKEELIDEMDSKLIPTQEEDNTNADTSITIMDGIRKLEKLLEQLNNARETSDLKQNSENNATANLLNILESYKNLESNKNETTDSNHRRQILYILF